MLFRSMKAKFERKYKGKARVQIVPHEDTATYIVITQIQMSVEEIQEFIDSPIEETREIAK